MASALAASVSTQVPAHPSTARHHHSINVQKMQINFNPFDYPSATSFSLTKHALGSGVSG